ncbi:MAG: Sec-independent protein translocase TatC [Acidobacteriaceae bacterium]|nr:Sec-independent protein translocase TatC [Acidobacteriaceae bacterium]
MPDVTAELPKSAEEPEQDSMPAMGFLEHLEELRKRLFYSIIAVLIGFGACWTFHEKIFEYMQQPIMTAQHKKALNDRLD